MRCCHSLRHLTWCFRQAALKPHRRGITPWVSEERLRLHSPRTLWCSHFRIDATPDTVSSDIRIRPLRHAPSH